MEFFSIKGGGMQNSKYDKVVLSQMYDSFPYQPIALN